MKHKSSLPINTTLLVLDKQPTFDEKEETYKKDTGTTCDNFAYKKIKKNQSDAQLLKGANPTQLLGLRIEESDIN